MGIDFLYRIFFRVWRILVITPGAETTCLLHFAEVRSAGIVGRGAVLLPSPNRTPKYAL